MQLIPAMHIALFATVLTLTLASINESELLLRCESVATTANADTLPAALEANKLSTETGPTSEAISRIKTALSFQMSNQLSEKKDDENILLEVIEDNGENDCVDQSSSSQAEDAKPSSTEPADKEPSSRIPKSRLNRKKSVQESESSYEEKRMEIINRMDRFIEEYRTHPLNKLVLNVMKTLSFFNEAKANEAWIGFGTRRQNFILRRISKFVEILVTLKHCIYKVFDEFSPIIHYGPNGMPLELYSTSRFDKIVKTCEELIIKISHVKYAEDLSVETKLGKMDFLAFVGMLLDLIDLGKLYNSVEIDIFTPLYKILKEVEKSSCGFPSLAKHGEPLNDSCLLIFREIVNDLEEVKAYLPMTIKTILTS